MEKRTFFLILSGTLWLVVGFFLMAKGLNYLIVSMQISSISSFSLIRKMIPFLGSPEKSAFWLIVLSMLVGWMKGRMVLAKAARKTITRLESLSRPIKVSDVYPLKYISLIAFMICLGISLKLLKIPAEVLGVIDVAIGTALVQGAVPYLRKAKTDSAAGRNY